VRENVSDGSCLFLLLTASFSCEKRMDFWDRIQATSLAARIRYIPSIQAVVPRHLLPTASTIFMLGVSQTRRISVHKSFAPHLNPQVRYSNVIDTSCAELTTLNFSFPLRRRPAPSHDDFFECVPVVLCDESGHIKFPFSYFTHVTLLTVAQARLSP